MLDNCRTAKDRWGGVSEMIDRWLRERQDLIVTYCDIIRTTDFRDAETARYRLGRFCEIMVDYVSAGHFEIYDQLIEEARDFDDGGLDLANRVYPRLTAITEYLLGFNDRFDESEAREEEQEVLYSELSTVGERLEERFEMEDLMIEALHNAHADQVA
ncbi:sigma D regulator [Marinobacteraceae bacterium S3BR75-40.1]